MHAILESSMIASAWCCAVTSSAEMKINHVQKIDNVSCIAIISRPLGIWPAASINTTPLRALKLAV